MWLMKSAVIVGVSAHYEWGLGGRLVDRGGSCRSEALKCRGDWLVAADADCVRRNCANYLLCGASRAAARKGWQRSGIGRWIWAESLIRTSGVLAISSRCWRIPWTPFFADWFLLLLRHLCVFVAVMSGLEESSIPKHRTGYELMNCWLSSSRSAGTGSGSTSTY